MLAEAKAVSAATVWRTVLRTERRANAAAVFRGPGPGSSAKRAWVGGRGLELNSPFGLGSKRGLVYQIKVFFAGRNLRENDGHALQVRIAAEWDFGIPQDVLRT